MQGDVLRDGPEYFFEEFGVGSVYLTSRRTLTEWDVMTFVTAGGFIEEMWFDPRKQEAALGRAGLVPGPLTLMLSEGLYVQTGRMRNAVGFLGMDEVRWHEPVCVGDAIRASIEVQEARRSTSRSDVGIVSTAHSVLNQDDAVVLTYRTARMHRCGPGAAGSRP